MADKTKTVSQRVVEYAQNRIGHKVGTGECWDLAFEALKHAGAKTPWDLNQTYVWGTEIARVVDVQPGDILQFEGVKIEWSWVTSKKNVTTTQTQTYTFAHHTAIVEKVDSGTFVTLLHSNVQSKPGSPHNRNVSRMQVNLSPENIRGGTITVYRPMAK